jgi:RNA-directed DNA polymerase
MGGKGEMTKASSSLQDLRRSLYVKAKAEPTWRFWGLYVHVCKRETLYEAYRMAKENDGAPGIDGVTFEAIEESGVESFLEQIRDELVSNTYRPMPARKKEIPKDGGKKVRVLSIPAIRDRVVQGALKLILEPIFEADFQSGSYGYRPKRTAHQAVNRVAQAIVESKTRIIDIDLRAYFDNVQHYLLLEKVARRVRDDAVMHLLKMMLKATGEKGVPQGGVMTPRTQKVTSNLSGGRGFGVNRVRIDACRRKLYVYGRCHAPAVPRRPSDSIAPGFCFSKRISFPMLSNKWHRIAPFHRVKPTVTSSRLSN